MFKTFLKRASNNLFLKFKSKTFLLLTDLLNLDNRFLCLNLASKINISAFHLELNLLYSSFKPPNIPDFTAIRDENDRLHFFD